ncbi:MAG TPA: alpha/beta hydrolase [Archangium sp.]|nr:alpha/beta hydrolase [Archangium sp.]
MFSPAELQAVRAPALLLLGEDETRYNAHTTLKRARERMPGLRGEIVPGVHHLAALARPDDVNRRLLEFLRGEHRAGEESEDAGEQSRILQ